MIDAEKSIYRVLTLFLVLSATCSLVIVVYEHTTLRLTIIGFGGQHIEKLNLFVGWPLIVFLNVYLSSLLHHHTKRIRDFLHIPG